MMKTNSTKKDVTSYLNEVAHKLPGLKKIVKSGIPIIDSLMRAGFTEKGNEPFKHQRIVEFGAGGIMSLYNIYRGIKQKKSYMVVQGVIIGTALTIIWISSRKKNIINTKSLHNN